MRTSFIRRGIAVGVSAMALAGFVATAMPANAASTKPSAPAAAPAPGATQGSGGAVVGAAATGQVRKPGGVRAQGAFNGVCEVYELCLYYYYNFAGSLDDFYYSDSNLNDNWFVSPGAGQYQHVGNNAESWWNRDPYYNVRAFTGANYTGYSVVLPRNSYANFTWVYPTYFADNIESFYWF
jgi:hypothetical protein